MALIPHSGNIPQFLTALFLFRNCFLLLLRPLKNQIRPLSSRFISRMKKEAAAVKSQDLGPAHFTLLKAGAY